MKNNINIAILVILQFSIVSAASSSNQELELANIDEIKKNLATKLTDTAILTNQDFIKRVQNLVKNEYFEYVIGWLNDKQEADQVSYFLPERDERSRSIKHSDERMNFIKDLNTTALMLTKINEKKRRSIFLQSCFKGITPNDCQYPSTLTFGQRKNIERIQKLVSGATSFTNYIKKFPVKSEYEEKIPLNTLVNASQQLPAINLQEDINHSGFDLLMIAMGLQTQEKR